MEENKSSEKAIDTAIRLTTNNIASHRNRSIVMLIAALFILVFFSTLLITNQREKRNLSNSLYDFVRFQKSPAVFLPASTDTTRNMLITNSQFKRIYERESELDSIISTLKKHQEGDNSLNFIIYGFFIIIFGVVISFYRFHLKEIAKYENFLLGFQRIRIAGNNSLNGYETEVRQALTQDAFVMETKSVTTKKTIESPIPGHPTSDLSVFLLNKIMDAIEVSAKKVDKDK